MSSAGVVVIRPFIEESLLGFPTSSTLWDSQESILIYLCMSGGSKVPMRIFCYESIESVKLQIQNCRGFVMKNQKLVCGGRELARSNSLVRDYGVTEGNVLHLVIRFSDLQAINVTTFCGKEFTIQVARNHDVQYVKRQIANTEDGLGDIDDHEVLCNGQKLEDQQLINDICNDDDSVIHLFVKKTVKIRAKPVEKKFELSIVASPQSNDAKREAKLGEEEILENNAFVPRKTLDREEVILEAVIVNPKIEWPLVITNLVNSVLEGLEKGNDPIRSSEGTGGAYFMPDASGSKYLAVFKPIDEEPMAVNNPQGLPLSVDGEGLKKGTRVGEGALRECAAYILDHPKIGRRSFVGELKGFAGVPPTCLVRCLHKGFNHPGIVKSKIGSLQMFMKNEGSCEDIGPSAFPIEEVHKIAVLDMRIANADRHAGNILVSKDGDGRISLIPIDHGYCLPESVSCFFFCFFDK